MQIVNIKLPNIVLIILSVFDIVTTWVALENGAKELNPFMASLGIGGIITVRFIFVIGAIYIIENHFIPHSEKYPILKYAPLFAYCAISTIWLAAVFNNLLFLLK
jgi:hypothetical protein